MRVKRAAAVVSELVRLRRANTQCLTRGIQKTLPAAIEHASAEPRVAAEFINHWYKSWFKSLDLRVGSARMGGCSPYTQVFEATGLAIAATGMAQPVRNGPGREAPIKLAATVKVTTCRPFEGCTATSNTTDRTFNFNLYSDKAIEASDFVGNCETRGLRDFISTAVRTFRISCVFERNSFSSDDSGSLFLSAVVDPDNTLKITGFHMYTCGEYVESELAR